MLNHGTSTDLIFAAVLIISTEMIINFTFEFIDEQTNSLFALKFKLLLQFILYGFNKFNLYSNIKANSNYYKIEQFLTNPISKFNNYFIFHNLLVNIE